MRVIRVATLPVDDEGNPLPGFVQVGTMPNGDLLLDAIVDAPGQAVVSEGYGRYAREALGAVADQVLEAVWERGTGEAKERVREKMVAAMARNPTVTILESDLPPHRWFGETPPPTEEAVNA